MDPAKRTFEEDIAGAVFQRGLVLGNWRVVEDGWPNPVIAVAAAARDGSPQEYALRFDLTGYPARAPTSQIWDLAKNTPLDPMSRPWGGHNVQKAFRTDWKPALYIPCDRVALESHPRWASKVGAWKSGDDITIYLKYVHALVNSPGYSGARSACAPA